MYTYINVHNVIQAEIYKEDFKNEREDREKAHDLKEEMRLACEPSAMAKERHAFNEIIQNLTRKLQEMSNEKEGVQERATRTSTRQHDVHQTIHELQHELYEARHKAITAQEEVQAKTAQVKQYKKKDDQREEKVLYHRCHVYSSQCCRSFSLINYMHLCAFI